MSGPIAGPRQLRVKEHQSYGRDNRDGSVDNAGQLSKSNSSADRIHLMISWKARHIFYVTANQYFLFFFAICNILAPVVFFLRLKIAKRCLDILYHFLYKRHV